MLCKPSRSSRCDHIQVVEREPWQSPSGSRKEPGTNTPPGTEQWERREAAGRRESRWEGVAWGNQAAGDANVTDVLTFKLNRKLRMFDAERKDISSH